MGIDDELDRAAEKIRHEIERKFASFPESRDYELKILEIAVALIEVGITRRFHNALTRCLVGPRLSRTTAGRICRRHHSALCLGPSTVY